MVITQPSATDVLYYFIRNGDRVLLLHTSHGENDSKEIEVEN